MLVKHFNIKIERGVLNLELLPYVKKKPNKMKYIKRKDKPDYIRFKNGSVQILTKMFYIRLSMLGLACLFIGLTIWTDFNTTTKIITVANKRIEYVSEEGIKTHVIETTDGDYQVSHWANHSVPNQLKIDSTYLVELNMKFEIIGILKKVSEK